MFQSLEVVDRFQICAILKRHNSIQHAERAMRHFETSQQYVFVIIVSIIPIAFPFPARFATFCISWFNLGSFLLLREFYKLQSKINLFFAKSLVQKRLREVFTIPGAFATPDVQTTYSIILLLAQILKMRQLNQMKRVVLGTKEVKRVSLLNQRYRFLILSQIKSVDQLKQVVVLAGHYAL